MRIRVIGLVAVCCAVALLVGCSQPQSGGGAAAPAKEAKGGRLFGV